MKIQITINTENAAFADDFSGEVLRVAERGACDALALSDIGGREFKVRERTLIESNGNACGFVSVTFDDSERGAILENVLTDTRARNLDREAQKADMIARTRELAEAVKAEAERIRKGE